MKKLFAWLCMFVSGAAYAAGAEIHLDEWPEARGKQLPALQNGARLFVNYCMGCHSAKLMRWNRLNAIGLDDRQIRDFLIFGEQKVGDPMTIAMRPADAKVWFGKAPPDLSVIVRARTSFEYKGTDYLYTLLRGYYRDASSPTGWNNVVYPSIAMPHILWERQGPREATIEKVHYGIIPGTGKVGLVSDVAVYDTAGNASVISRPITGPGTEGISFSFKPVDPARARQFDNDVADLVAYLVFMTDPSASTRVRIGVWVLLALGLFTVIAWWLNREYWKDVK
jgi:ubiquinol-cytochrome c reductase cytochrome c1 subunit